MKNYLSMSCKTLLIVLLTSLIGLSSFAQRKGKHDKIQNLKIKFISEKLNLSPQSAKDFWPIYNQYDEAKQRLFRKYRRKYKKEMESKPAMGQGMNPQRKLSLQAVEHRMEREKEFLDLRKRYINRFAKVLTPVQLADLKRSERQFKKLLLKRINH